MVSERRHQVSYHTYDRMNNKLTEEKLHSPENSETYAYDSAYRLVSFDRPMIVVEDGGLLDSADGQSEIIKDGQEKAAVWLALEEEKGDIPAL